jgi:hypothetical protein
MNMNDFSPASRVWVYVSNRALSESEAAQVQMALEVFCRQWTAHNQALQAAGRVVERQAIVLLVDETRAGASGCSIDKSVHFLEDLGGRLGVDFFDRMRFGFQDAATGVGRWVGREELSALVQNGEIGQDTLMYNTLVTNKEALDTRWLVPFGESWHRRLV